MDQNLWPVCSMWTPLHSKWSKGNGGGRIVFQFLVCLHGDYESKYNFLETPRKFTIAKLSIRKPGSSSVLIIMNYIMHYHYITYGSETLR